MDRQDLKELHYITPIANVPSILEQGLLSHNRVQGIVHESVAMPEIQDRRRWKKVPNARPLHDYVNLYFHAHNPMLYTLKGEHESLCVLQISPDVLDLPGVVITDGNAACRYTQFYKSPDGLQYVDGKTVFADSWIARSEKAQLVRKRIKCAEGLVPDHVESRYIVGAYVVSKAARQVLENTGFILPIKVDAKFFFR